MGRILRNYIKTKKEFKIFYRKSIGVLLEITSGNIEKEKLNLKELIIICSCLMSDAVPIWVYADECR